MRPDETAGLFSAVARLEIEVWHAVDKRLREGHGLPLSRLGSRTGGPAAAAGPSSA